MREHDLEMGTAERVSVPTERDHAGDPLQNVVR